MGLGAIRIRPGVVTVCRPWRHGPRWGSLALRARRRRCLRATGTRSKVGAVGRAVLPRRRGTMTSVAGMLRVTGGSLLVSLGELFS